MKTPVLPINEVKQLYLQQERTLEQVADHFGVSAWFIRKVLVQQGVRVRTLAEAITKHGQSRTPEWKACWSARDRCTNSKHKQYYRYGGRGIKFCFKSVEDATKYVLRVLGPRQKNHSLDRKNNDGHYEKGNLRWATRRVQQLNRGEIPLRRKDVSTSVLIFEYKRGFGSFTLSQKYNIDVSTVLRRLRKAGVVIRPLGTNHLTRKAA